MKGVKGIEKGRVGSSNCGNAFGRPELAVQPDNVSVVAGTGGEEGGHS